MQKRYIVDLSNIMTPLQNLRNEIVKDGSEVPPYLNIKLAGHKMIWYELQMIFTAIHKLSTNKVLSNVTIVKLLAQVKEHIEMILQANDDEIIEIQLAEFIRDRTLHYEQTAVDQELYEVAANFNSFNKWYNEF